MGRRGRTREGDLVANTAFESFGYADFKGCDLITGATLVRLWHDEKIDENTHRFWAYLPTPHMIEIQCDACLKQHSDLNIKCSATTREKTPMSNKDCIYSFKTKEEVSNSYHMMIDEDATVTSCTIQFKYPIQFD